MSVFTVHGEILDKSVLPRHLEVPFTYHRKKYIAFGWYEDSKWMSDELHVVVIRAAGKDKGKVTHSVPMPNGSFPLALAPRSSVNRLVYTSKMSKAKRNAIALARKYNTLQDRLVKKWASRYRTLFA